MTADFFSEMLTMLVNRRPYRPFTIKLVGGRRLEIDFPNAISFREGKAAFIAPGFIPILFDNESVTAIVDADASTAA